MSLRGFHIVFITLTSVLSVFMLLWAVLWAPGNAGIVAPIMGIIGALGAIGFPIYGIYFYRKAKNLII